MKTLNIDSIKNVHGGAQFFCSFNVVTDQLVCAPVYWNTAQNRWDTYQEPQSIPYTIHDGSVSFFV